MKAPLSFKKLDFQNYLSLFCCLHAAWMVIRRQETPGEQGAEDGSVQVYALHELHTADIAVDLETEWIGMVKKSAGPPSCEGC